MSDENVEHQPPIIQPVRPHDLPPQAAAALNEGAQQQQQQPPHAAGLMNLSRQIEQSPQHLRGGESSSSANNSEEDDEGLEESEYLSQSFANNIFSSAESGFAIVIFKLLSSLEDDKANSTILNQVIILFPNIVGLFGVPTGNRGGGLVEVHSHSFCLSVFLLIHCSSLSIIESTWGQTLCVVIYTQILYIFDSDRP